jgi:RNA polymerase sigma factor (sigma-70 family)
MVNKVIQGECRIGNHLRWLRQQAGLSRTRLAEISGISHRFIQAVEEGSLCNLISKQLHDYASDQLGQINAHQVMLRILMHWAGQLHRLTHALDTDFETIFPDEYLADECDQLWQRVCQIHPWPDTTPQQPGRDGAANPWHAWGWFKEESLSDDLAAEDSDKLLEPDGLGQILHTVLASLPLCDQTILARRYGLFDGCAYTRREVSEQLGLTVQRVQQLEERALRRLRHPYRSRQLRDYWERE